MNLRTGLPLLAAVLATAVASPAQVSFNRDIRPIMADTCFRCHGPDRNARMAGMRLDIRDEALKPTASDAVPIVPGDPERSAIVQRIFATDARLMPPAFAHKALTEVQKETIRRWVAEGAKYEGHWAYLPVTRPTPPAGQRHPIDAFIQTRLAREGLQLAPEADRRTLIRRVTLDLTGLPPAPRDVEAFVAGKSAGAYEKLVDRLLASPRYAEKQAMHWLDAVRYADTSGFHSDLPYPIWPYRDYVLRAFRDNKPFDVFTREQLAGDLMPNATTEQKVASAYNRLSRMSPEGGLQPKEYLAKYAADRVRTTSTVWLGSTLGCAECHDHKFDPFLSKDFYSMKAFFADLLETGRSPDRGPTAWGTKLDLPTEEQQRRREQLNWRLTEARRLREQDARALNENEAATWEAEVLRRYEAGELNWRYQRPLSAESANGSRLTVYNDEPVESNYYLGGTLIAERAPGNGLVVASGPNPDNETYTVTLRPGEGVWTALGLEVVHDENLPSHRLARGADRLVVTEVEAEVSSDDRSPARRLPFVLASASQPVEPPELHPMAVIDGDPRTGWGVASSGDYGNLFLALRFAQALRTDAASVLTVRIRHDSEFRRAVMGRFRLTLSSGVYSWPEPENLRARLRKDTNAPAPDKDKHGVPNPVLTALRTPEDKRTDEHRRTLLDYYQWLAPDLQARTTEIAKLEAALGQLDAEIPKVVVSQATRPPVTRILPRSNWMDETGEVVQPAIPVFLGKLSSDGRATRLDLANWLVSPDNPLTARVFVNRLWREFFGAGLVKTLDDLGSQGEWPAYPEVLDWLAAEFMQPAWQASGTHPWDMRHAVRTIVTSRAYRQSSLGTPELNERDPDNRLLARQSRFRVDAEVVHDIALDVSGLLVEKFGGPSVRPYQPDGYLAALNFPKREWAASRGEDLYRRAVYMFWQRTFLHPTLMNFDASTREECTVSRVNSNTPLQALDLLNDPIYVEAARVFAQNTLKDGGRSLADRLDWAFARAASRKPSEDERRTLAGLYRESLKRFQAAPADAQQLIHVGEAPLLTTAEPAELAAMTTVARAILNLHETIARD